MLESNGLVWMLSSLLSNRKLAAAPPRQRPRVESAAMEEGSTLDSGDDDVICETPSDAAVAAAAPTAAAVSAVAAATGATAGCSRDPVKINIQNMTQKLPAGQSLITVNDGSRAIMQASGSFPKRLNKCLVAFKIKRTVHETPTVDLKGLLSFSTCPLLLKRRPGSSSQLILRKNSHCTLVVLERGLTLNPSLEKGITC